jgi:hypothetical protein
MEVVSFWVGRIKEKRSINKQTTTTIKFLTKQYNRSIYTKKKERKTNQNNADKQKNL